MNFEIEELELPEVKLINAKRFYDARGFFSEIYKVSDFTNLGLPPFVQDNLSSSMKGVIRGLHWQEEPFGQGKLVQCVNGSILDVVVDVRKGSQNFGKHVSITLKASEQSLVWVPIGFAHGFQALEDNTTVIYKVTNYWKVESEKSLNPLDPALGIEWPVQDVLVSDKDKQAPYFNNLVHE